jgi:hypothetical protein
MADLNEAAADAATAILGENREPVHVAPPPVPGGDKNAHDLPAVIGHEQSILGVLDESHDACRVVGREGGGTTRLLPQLQNRLNILHAGDPDAHIVCTW